jgi:hypothetical protein
MFKHPSLTLAMVIGIALGGASRLCAQTSSAPPTSLKGLFLGLGNSTQVLTGGVIPAAVFENVGAISELATLEVSTAPVGTSTGGFTFAFDSQLQTWTRTAQSFGPAFAERSLTTGKSRFSAGFNFLHAAYDSIAGQDMKNGDLRVGQNAQSPVLPIAYSTLKIDMTSDTLVGFAVVGVTDDLDVGVTIPWVRVSASGEIAAFTSTNVDVFAGRHPQFPTTSAAGVGDIAIFGKYHVWHHNGGGLAGEVQMHLPTGDADNLRGAGVTRTQLSAIFSQGGRVAPHVNVGYEFWSSGVVLAASRNISAKNQFTYALGLEFEAHPRVTVAVDVLGRRLLNGGQLAYIKYNLVGVPGSFDELEAVGEGLNVVSLAPGIKWNVWRKLLVTANVLGSMANDGVRAKVTPVFGLDWAF